MHLGKSSLSLFLLLLLVFGCKDHSENPAKAANPSTSSIPELSEPISHPEAISESLEHIKDSILENGEKISHPEDLKEFYTQRKFQPAWEDPELRTSLYKNIENIGEEGLLPSDYHLEYLKRSLFSLDKVSEEERTRTEIILTDAFFQLAKHLSSGKLNPKKLYKIWDIDTNEINIAQLLENAISKKDINSALDSVRPHHIVYNGLKKSLAEYEQLRKSEKEITKIPEGKAIKIGESDSRIPLVRKRLKELELLDSKKSPDSLKNTYTTELAEAVKRFQQKYSLQTDGIIGERTIVNLNMTNEERYEQILVNLERWRWYPRDFGPHYIIINIANFRLHVVKNGDTISTHRTIIGTEARKTPVFSRRVQYVVYNPTWTIPPTIKRKDVIPSASKNISYLEGHKINIYDANGKKVNPDSVNWRSPDALKYTYRQNAGSTNPLGKVKIIYPNRHMVYLHDTPNHALFDQNRRAHSSGCVRVENALELAKYLLSNQPQYDDDRIEKILDSGKTTEIKVTQPVEVYHLYWTAWRENGATRFTDDVYNLDSDIYRKLSSPTN